MHVDNYLYMYVDLCLPFVAVVIGLSDPVHQLGAVTLAFVDVGPHSPGIDKTKSV